MPNKKIIVSVSNDLSNDQRVHRVCSSLTEFGHDVVLCGRKLRNSPAINRQYKTKRFRLLFNKGMMFYACLNARLLCYYIFNKVDLILANDLDTLASAGIASKLKRCKIIYDSHELFTEVPELENKPRKKKIWLKIEKRFIKRASASYTVCQPIADYYNSLYDINMQVIRNLPKLRTFSDDYETRPKLLIYQGALNKERGIEIMIQAMQYIPDYQLIISGKGDLEKELKQLVNELNLNEKVQFTGNLDFEALYNLTKTARLGFSLEQGKSLNYKYSLPNKIFDYIQAGVPVICSDLPEMSKIVKKHGCGTIAKTSDQKELAEFLKSLLADNIQLNKFHQNCKIAAKELNWENEEKILKEIFTPLL
ncbi:MAG: glycosyltransferase [Bacteroidales bacterium]|nr:glycosyltransferase [Bacteroidales bacterium]